MKQTEIGLIPDDWEVKEFNQVATLINGRAYSQSELLKQGKYKVLRVGNFGTNDTWYYSNLELPEKQYCNKGDLLYCWSCTYGAYIWNEDDTIYHYHIWKIQTNNADKYYLKYILNNDIASQMSNSNGSTMAHITKGFLEKRRFVFPPFEEQQRIAKALSDVDALISTTGKLLQNKKNIKQGTMQELLTGKKRLPDFAPVVVEPVETSGYKQTELGLIPEDWEVKNFDVLFDICTETVPLADINQKYYVGTENMMQDKKGVVENSIELKYQSVREYLKEDILISNIRPYLKKVWFADKNGGCSTDVLVFRNKRMQNDSLFLFMLVSADRFFQIVNDNAVGTKMPRGDKNIIKQILFALPSSKEEQTAIANVLSSMDKEIETLNTKLEKYRNLKTAMMQQLLTGKIRLVN